MGDMTAGLAEAWEGVLWDAKGARLCPSTIALDRAILHNDSTWRTGRYHNLFTAAREGPCGRLFFLPTTEWADMTAGWLRSRGYRKVLEVGAGDGFTARCLAEHGPMLDVVATDDLSWEILPRYYPVAPFPDPVSVALLERPDIILWAWSPMSVPDAVWCGLLEIADVLVIGEGPGGCTGYPFRREDWSEDELECDERLRQLDDVARGRTDSAMWVSGPEPYRSYYSTHMLYRRRGLLAATSSAEGVCEDADDRPKSDGGA